MMTPSELREYEFKGAGRNAYKSDDVDNFFGEVAVAYEKIFRENAELVKRINLLADRLEQFKQDEAQIKQAVLGAQKAADLIVKEAEMSVEDAKAEGEAILAAAKGEADVIKSDAEKQAIADSDLLLSIARDKAEEIINKAKEEAHGILIAANDSASDTVGAATRTITSESIHYDMLKKEVSEFRASILAQYKAHIELISKLPELAVEAAEELDADESDADIVEEISAVDPENTIIEFISEEDDNNSEEYADTVIFNSDFDDEEEVVKTTLPYDFFEDSNEIEFVDEPEEEDGVPDASDFEAAFSQTGDDIEFISDDNDENDVQEQEETVAADESEEDSFNEEPADIPISKGFSLDVNNVSEDLDVFSSENKEPSSFFDSFESIDTDDEDENEDDEDEPKKKRGFFRRKK